MGSLSTTTDYNNNNAEYDKDDVDSLFTPLSARGVLRRSAGILWDNLALFMTMAAVVVTPIALILAVALFTINWEMILPDADNPDYPDSDYSSVHARPLLLVLLLVLVINTFVGTAIQAAVIRVVADVYAGNRPLDLQQALTVYLSHYLLKNASLVCSIVCYNFLVHVGIFVGVSCLTMIIGMAMVLCTLLINLILNETLTGWIFVAKLANFVRLSVQAITSIYVRVSMFAAIPSLVLEQGQQQGGGFLGAMQRSWDLVTTRRCFVLAAKAWYALAVWVPFLIMALIIVVVVDSMLWCLFWILLVFALVNLVVVPFHAIFQGVLYLTVRIEKEGFRQSVLVREIGSLTEQYNSSGDRADETIMKRSNNIMLNDSSSGSQAPIFKTDESLTTVDDHNGGLV